MWVLKFVQEVNQDWYLCDHCGLFVCDLAVNRKGLVPCECLLFPFCDHRLDFFYDLLPDGDHVEVLLDM